MDKNRLPNELLYFMRYFFSVILFLSSCAVQAQLSLSQQKAEQLYAKASQLKDQSNYGAARIAYVDFLNVASPNDNRKTEAEYQITFAALQLNNIDAENLSLQFINKYGSHPRSNQLKFDVGSYFYKSAKYPKAIEHFSRVDYTLLSAEQQIQCKFQLGYSYFSERKLADALLFFNQIKSFEHTYTAASNYYAGFIEYNDGKYDDALRDLKRAESNEAYATIVPYLIASTYYRQGKYDDLLAYADKVKDNEVIKNRKELFLLMAEALYARNDFAKAAVAYNECLTDKTVGDAGVWYRAGVSNDKAGDKAKAIHFLELSAATKEDVSYVSSFQLGILYLQQSEKEYALNAFDRARKSKDTGIAEQAQFNYAKVLYDNSQSDKAIVEFEYYLSAFPQGTFGNDTRELLAQAYVNGNNYNKALTYIESLQVKSPAVEQAYQKAAFLKGAEHFNKNEYIEAAGFFTKSLSFPRDAKYVQRAAFWCAEIYSIQKKYAEAEPLYQQAVRTSNDVSVTAQANYGLGYAYYNQKQFEKALACFQSFVSKSTKQTDNYADGMLRLADCFYIGKKFDDAIGYYNQYKQTNAPDADYAYLQSGLIYGLQRKYTESRTQFTQLINAFPASSYRAEAMYQRAQFDIEQGSYANAIESLSQLISNESTSAYVPYAYARRAASYFNTKEVGKTIDDYVALIKTYPTHPLSQEVLLPLQEALELQNRSSEFDQYLATVKNANPDKKGLENLEFETAKKLYFSEQYDKAIVSLQTFINTYRESAFKAEANYYIAESYYRQRKWEQALPVYAQLKEVAAFTYAARVAGRLAELTFKLGRYEEAIAHYHYFEKYTSTKKDLYNALSGIMESFFYIGQYDSTVFYAQQILERAAINAGAENKASLFIGKSAMARGDYEGAEDEFLNTLNTARDEYGAEAKYQLATIFFLRKDYKQCHETLLSLNRDFKTYEFWVGKSFLLLADNYASQQNLFQAKATLQSLVDNFPLETIKSEAALKLKELEKQQAPVSTDTLDNN